MRSLLDDLRHAATPLQVTSREQLVHDMKAAHAALLRSGLGVSTGQPPQITDLRRYALWLEDVALGSGQLPEDETESALNLAAALYEFVGQLGGSDGSGSVFQPPLNDLLRSAVLGSVTGYQAQCSLVARRIKRRLAATTPSSAVESLHRAVALVLTAFLGREFHDALSSVTRLRPLASEAVQELLARDATNQDYLEVDRATALALTCTKAAGGMLFGASDSVAAAAQDFGRIAEAAKESLDAQRHWLAQRLQSVTEHMHRTSMHRVLKEARVSSGFRTALVRDGVFELWRPQLEAIEAGLLRTSLPPNFVVTLPTGTGKTLLAELAILTALKGGDNAPSWAMYITPSRALVSQVSNDLRRRLTDAGITVQTVLAGAEQNDLLVEELKVLARAKSVTVTTPEKLDSYYRNAREIFDSCALVIFDEVHKAGEAGRGALLESLITRFVVLQPQTQLMLLSGVLSNHDDLVAWLGGANTRSIVARRRSTRQIRGVTVRHNPVPREAYTGTKGTMRRVDYQAGLLLVHEREDLQAPFEVQVPSVFSGYYTEKLYRDKWREERSAAHSPTTAHAIALSRVLSRAPGTTLVFVQTTTWAESCCRDFLAGMAGEFEPAPERERLAHYLAAQLGDGHDLVGYCRRGAAFHHSRLPSGVQRAIEWAIEQGWLKVVFTTSTLREGLNTAATNVVVVGDSQWDDAVKARVPVREPDFENVAGRAGRPFRDTEGRVILVPDSMAMANVVTASQRYMLVGEEALRVRSQLNRLAMALYQCDDDIERMPENEQSLLLTLAAADLMDDDALAAFFAQSLWSVQVEDDEEPNRAATACARAFAQAEARIGLGRLQLASRTGFALGSAELLHATLSEHAAEFVGTPFTPLNAGIESLLPRLLEAALLVPEVRQRAFKTNEDWHAHLEPLWCWLRAEKYEDILYAAKKSTALPEKSNLGDIVRYCSEISTWLSWAFGACYTVLDSLVEYVHPWVGLLPLLTRYGVPSRVAAYISLHGVVDRQAAQVLAERFEQTGRAASFQEIGRWMLEVEEQLDDIFPQRDLRSDLLRRQAFGARRKALPYTLAAVKVVSELTEGQIVSLHPRGGEGIDLFDQSGDLVGEIADPKHVLAFTQGQLETVFGVIADASGSKTQAPQVAVVRLPSEPPQQQ